MREESIPWAQPIFWGNEKKYINKAIDSTWISGGPFVERFELEFARCNSARYAVSTLNGTTSLHLAFLALGIKPEDEIIVPGFGFHAAANLALQFNAKPVFTEVDPHTWCMSAAEIEKCLSPRTRAIVPIHTYGNVCSMEEIIDLAKSRHIEIVEDVAQAHFSCYKNKPAGTMGSLGCFSLHAAKTITTGEGGMVVTNDEALLKKLHLYRNHGIMEKYYWHHVPGHNFRLSNLHAAIGCAQLENLDLIINHRKRIHKQYKKSLSRIPGVTLQYFSPDVNPVLWVMAIKLDPKAFPQGRDTLMQQLKDENIETRPGFYSASLMDIYPRSRLPICDETGQQIICLPTFATLTNEQIDFICEKINKFRR